MKRKKNWQFSHRYICGNSKIGAFYDFPCVCKKYFFITNFFLFHSKTGASSSRVSIPPLSPQGQQSRPHNLQQPGLPVPGFEANLVSVAYNFSSYINKTNTFSRKSIHIRTQHSDIGGFSLLRNQSPPPAHQQASPITPVNLVNFDKSMQNSFQSISFSFPFFRRILRSVRLVAD